MNKLTLSQLIDQELNLQAIKKVKFFLFSFMIYSEIV